MKHTYLLVVLLFTLSSCVGSNDLETITSEVEDSFKDTDLHSDSSQNAEPIVLQNSPIYLAKNEGELSELDFETAYEMCVQALTDYYQAIWSGSDVELDRFIENENLKQYTQEKIRVQYQLYATHNVTDEVRNIEIDDWEVEYRDDVDGGFLYLKLPVKINKTIGGYSEPTEFLVRNVNGKLVIVDWYTCAKDSYDFIERGEYLTIDNPNVWNASE